MRPSTYAGIALLVSCGAAFAQQPLALPGRSQSTGQQSVDNAACYAYANQTTKVVMAREAQTAPKNNAIETRTLGAPRPVEPPLPPLTAGALAASGAVPASGASASVAAHPAGASAAVAAGASAPRGASGAAVAAGASGASGASAAVAASGASDANYAEMKMPPMPPPEPPMVRYWRAYGECMQNRGYYVR